MCCRQPPATNLYVSVSNFSTAGSATLATGAATASRSITAFMRPRDRTPQEAFISPTKTLSPSYVNAFLFILNKSVTVNERRRPARAVQAILLKWRARKATKRRWKYWTRCYKKTACRLRSCRQRVHRASLLFDA